MLESIKSWIYKPARRGDAAEQAALSHLQRAGLALVCRNYRASGGASGKQLGEIDLIMRDADNTLIFVEVRERGSDRYGGAAASVTLSKQRRLIKAAQHYLLSLNRQPACRFDVVTVQPQGDGRHVKIEWIPNAFDASSDGS